MVWVGVDHGADFGNLQFHIIGFTEVISLCNGVHGTNKPRDEWNL